MCSHVCAHVWEYIWKPKVMVECLSQSLSTLFFETGFTEPLNLELKDAARMVGQQAPGTSLLVSAFPALGLEEHATAPNPSVPNTILSSSLLPTGVV